MTDVKNILFASIKAIPILDKEKAASEILSLNQSLSFWDEYRSTRMFPLMTKNSETGYDGSSNKHDGFFDWTTITSKTPTIKEWCDKFVFPWLGMKTRMMALVTMPGESNHEHFDCSPNELNTLQHKFRIVLQGKTDTLYWLTDKGNVKAPNIDNAFIMDGGWPHGMTNSTDKPKVTIALGAPWSAKKNYGSDIEVLQTRDQYNMPKKIDHLWKR